MLLPLRRKTAFASAALVLTAALSSCGFDPATDRVNNIATGATDQSGEVNVLDATIVAAESGEAVLIGALANGDREESDALTSVVFESDYSASDFEPVEMGPGGFVKLQDLDTPVTVEGEPPVGAYLPMTLVFESGEQVEVKVPVFANCGIYADTPGLPDGEPRCELAEREGGH